MPAMSMSRCCEIARKATRGVLTGVFGLSFWGAFIVPVLILAGQVIVFLQSGAWPTLSVADGLLAVGDLLPRALVTWLITPTSWYGLHKIVAQVPLAFALFVLGFGVMYALGVGTDGWQLWNDDSDTSAAQGTRGDKEE
jgi:hypothetical protein